MGKYAITGQKKPVSVTCDRKLRPMIQTKQLDLPQSINDVSYVSQPTPRTNLAKELEKYNRPPGK